MASLVTKEQRSVRITIPKGCGPGNMVTVNLPDGRSVKVVVPKGMKAGNILTINYTATVASEEAKEAAPEAAPEKVVREIAAEEVSVEDSSSSNHCLTVVVRGMHGVHMSTFDSVSCNWTEREVSGILKDAEGWNQPQFYSTMRAVRLHDRTYIFARGMYSVVLAHYDHAANSWSDLVVPGSHKYFTDAQGWGDEKYYSSIRCVALGSKVYVFARGQHSTVLISHDHLSNTWTEHASITSLEDVQGWSAPEFLSTLRVTPLMGKLYLFVRGANEVFLSSYDPASDTWTRLPGITDIADSAGWNQPQYYSTLRCVALGHRLYVFGRGANSTALFSFDSLTQQWSTHASTQGIADEQGWSQPMFNDTLSVTALMGKLYLFVRGNSEPFLASYDPAADAWTKLSSKPGLFATEQGWGEHQFYSTIRCVATSGKLFVFARGANVTTLHSYDPISNTWTEHATGLANMTDATGWANEIYYSTIRVL